MEKPDRRRTDKVARQNVGFDAPVSPSATSTHSGVARRAYELYLARGGDHGHNVDDDWRQAERELRGHEPDRSVSRTPHRNRTS